MNCNRVERQIIESGGLLGSEAAEHIKHCASCRSLAGLQRVLLEHPPRAVPPPELDQAVLLAAGERLRRTRHRQHRLLAWLPAAAALVLIATLVGVLLPRGGSAPGPGIEFAAAGTGFSPWARALVDFEAIDDEVEAVLTEMGGVAAGSENAPSAIDPWDDLLELELDLYFEMQRLQVDG